MKKLLFLVAAFMALPLGAQQEAVDEVSYGVESVQSEDVSYEQARDLLVVYLQECKEKGQEPKEEILQVLVVLALTASDAPEDAADKIEEILVAAQFHVTHEEEDDDEDDEEAVVAPPIISHVPTELLPPKPSVVRGMPYRFLLSAIKQRRELPAAYSDTPAWYAVLAMTALLLLRW